MGFIQDLRYAARGLRRDRALSTVIVLTLTLGIAANAVMFGVVDQLLLRPPPGIGHADAVRRVYFGSDAPQPATQIGRGRRSAPTNSYPVVAAIRDRVEAFEAAATTYRTEVTLGAGTDARLATLELVNPDYFPLLELRPAAGRFFNRIEDAEPVVVLSHRFWMSEFSGGQDAIGRGLRVEGTLLTVVGVAPAGFSGIDRRPLDFWVPVGALGRALLGEQWASNYGRFAFGLVARLSPGATPALANAQATAAYRRTAAASPFPPDPGATAFVVPLNGLRAPNGVATEGKVGLWLLGVAVVVLVIACANVANLLLTRTLARRREIAVRMALGVSRGRLLRQLLAESALLTTVAATVALVVTYVGGRLVQHVLLPGFAWDDRVVDGRVLATTLGIATLTALGAGMASAFYTVSTDISDALRTAPRVTGGRTGLLRTGLLVAQATLCVILLVGAGLFVRSLHAVRGADVGIDLDRVIEASLPDREGTSAAEAEALYARGMERLATIPGVARVTVTRASAPMKRASGISVLPHGSTREQMRGRSGATYSVVTAGYFATLGARLERGRELTLEEERTPSRVAVINRALAAEYWPGADPLGQCMRLGSDSSCTQIVGIVEDILLFSRLDTDRAQLYLPPSHPAFGGGRPTGLLIRADCEAGRLVPLVRRELQALTPDMPYVAVNTMDDLVAPQLQPWRLGMAMFTAFGAVALLIAAVGLFSTMAYTVSQRTHEIGVRMALGASPWQVIALVGAHGAATIATAIALGLLLAAVATRWLSDLLYRTSPLDPIVFATVAGLLTIVGVAAAVVPARRAADVDPLRALRAE